MFMVIHNKRFEFFNLMIKIFISANLLIFLVACKVQKEIIYESFKAFICEENDKSFKKYIFDINTGYLYFYSLKKDKFIPLTLRYEAGFYSEDRPEVFSTIQKNKLIITEIEYNSKYENGYHKIKRSINLDNLIQKIVYKNDKEELVSLKVGCKWIDPKLNMKI